MSVFDTNMSMYINKHDQPINNQCLVERLCDCCDQATLVKPCRVYFCLPEARCQSEVFRDCAEFRSSMFHKCLSGKRSEKNLNLKIKFYFILFCILFSGPPATLSIGPKLISDCLLSYM